MLVCSVSLRPPRRVIATGLAEPAAAVDAIATGNIVFATLVDDPAAVDDRVDAYLGEIMLEAANASDAITAGSVFSAAVEEAATASDAPDATTTASAARQAMIAAPMPVFVNSDVSRQAYADGVMVNQ